MADLSTAEIHLAHRAPPARAQHPSDRRRPLDAELTRRELEVLAMLAEGETNARIAQRLVVSRGHRQDAREAHPPEARRAQPLASRVALLHCTGRAKMPPSRKKDHHFARCGCSGHRAVWVDGDHPREWPCPPGVPGSGAGPPEPLLSIVVPTKNERDNVAALVERLEAGASHRRDGDRLRGRQRRRHARGGRGRWPQRTDARSCCCRSRTSGASAAWAAAVVQGLREARGSVGLRDGRRPSAPARADRGAARAGRVARARRRGGEPLLRRAATPGASAGRARWPLGRPRRRRGCCSRGACATSPTR